MRHPKNATGGKPRASNAVAPPVRPPRVSEGAEEGRQAALGGGGCVGGGARVAPLLANRL